MNSENDAAAAARDLKRAIETGDKSKVNKAVLELLKKKVSVKIDTISSYVPKSEASTGLQRNERILLVSVECLEKQFEKKLMLTVTPDTKIIELKEKVSETCKIDAKHQFWIICNEIRKDQDVIGHCDSKDIVLYISANAMTKEDFNAYA